MSSMWRNSQSPDLNPTERLCDELERWLRPRPSHPTSVSDLTNAFFVWMGTNSHRCTPKCCEKPSQKSGGCRKKGQLHINAQAHISGIVRCTHTFVHIVYFHRSTSCQCLLQGSQGTHSKGGYNHLIFLPLCWLLQRLISSLKNMPA